MKIRSRKFRQVRFMMRVFLISLFTGVVLLALVGGLVWFFRGRILRTVALYLPDTTLPTIVETPVVPIAAGEIVPPSTVALDIKKEEQPVAPSTLSVTEVVAKANDSVVSITIASGTGNTIGKGTGFFVSKDGLVVTNRHVIESSGATITVMTSDGVSHAATLVAIDPVLDIAILRVKGSFTPLALGNSDSLSSGQSVVAIGYALGTFQNSVSVGVISGLSRSIVATGNNGEVDYLDQVIQTDAAINRGNSGGPLIDLFGKVVGVNVATATTSQSIGFALPINDVRSAVTSVQKTGRIIRPYVGVRYTQITSEVAAARSLPVSYGVLIEQGRTSSESAVIADSPAEKAGLGAGDIILSVDSIKLDQAHSFASVIRQKTVGTTVSLKVLRSGVEQTVRIVLVEMPR